MLRGARPVFLRHTRTFFSNQIQTHNVSKTVSVAAPTMYRVVALIDEYQAFVPYCELSWVTARDDEGKPVLAGLQVGFELYNERFECVISCDHNRKVISQVSAESNDLFETLYTEWTFKETPRFGKRQTGDSCQVALQLRFKFRNPLYNQVSKMFGERVTSIMIKAFEQRALQLQGFKP